MAYALISQGSKESIGQLGQLDSLFKEGQRGYLELELLWAPPGLEQMVGALDWVLRQAGVELTRDSEISSNKVRIYFKRAIPPLIIVAASLVGLWLIILAGWKLFREEAKELGIFIIILVAIIIGAIVLIATKGKLAMPGLAVGR